MSDAPTPARPADDGLPAADDGLPPDGTLPDRTLPDRTPPDRTLPDRTPPDMSPRLGPPPRPGGGGLAPLPPLPPVPPVPRTAWGARFAVLALGAVAGISGYIAATRFLPRWWAEQIGGVAGGASSASIPIGLCCGVAFTLLPLLVLGGILRRSVTWATRFLLLVLAFLLSVPNLITLFVALGMNDDARIAGGTMDQQAPGFRDATLVGAVGGAVLAVGIWWLRWELRRRRLQVAALEARLAEKAAGGPASTAPKNVPGRASAAGERDPEDDDPVVAPSDDASPGDSR